MIKAAWNHVEIIAIHLASFLLVTPFLCALPAFISVEFVQQISVFFLMECVRFLSTLLSTIGIKKDSSRLPIDTVLQKLMQGETR